MHKLVTVGLLAMLTGCATNTAKYYTQTNPNWLGSNSQSLINAWGQPNARLQQGHNQRFYYYKTKGYVAPATLVAPVGVNVSRTGRPVIINTNNTFGSSQSNQTILKCTAIFDVNAQGIITRSEMLGNGC